MNYNQRLFVAGTPFFLIGVLFSVLTITVDLLFMGVAVMFGGIGSVAFLTIPCNLLDEDDSEP